MKTAEEWFKEFPDNYDACDLIKVAQLDAFKAGMKHAAKLAGDIAKLYDDMPSTCAALIKVPTAIKSASEKLTQLP